MKGYVALKKTVFRLPFYREVEKMHLFLYLLMNACFSSMHFDGQHLNRGQILTSIRKLSKSTGLSEWSVRKILKQLEEQGEILIEKTLKGSIVSVVKHDSLIENPHTPTHTANHTEIHTPPENSTGTPLGCVNEDSHTDIHTSKNEDTHTLNIINNNKLNKKYNRDSARETSSELIQKLLDSYPNLNGDVKGVIDFIKVQNFNEETVEIILDKINLFKHSHDWKFMRGRYIPQALKFFQQETWRGKPKNPEIGGVHNNQEDPHTGQSDALDSIYKAFN